MDFVSNNAILPLGGFLIGLFAGWFLDQKILAEQLEGTPEIVIKLLRVLMRVIAPVCIFVVFVMTFVG
jgi:NSS family neurotransmitter:Na+ symporter